MEKFILGIYTIYAISISYMAYEKSWAGFGTGVILISYFGVLIAMISRYGDFYIRSMLLTVGISILIFYRGMSSEEINDALPTIFLLCACIAMMGIVEEIAVVGLVTIFQEIHYIVVLIRENRPSQEIIGFLFQIFGSLLYVLVLYLWARHRAQNSNNVAIQKEKPYTEQFRDDFLANVSHEIRTPLNVINSITETLDPDGDQAVIKEELGNIKVAAKRLTFMVSDIMNFSELLSGRSELEEEAYSISTTVHDIIDMAYAALDNNTVEFLVDVDCKIPQMLMGDEKKIRRIIMNFVDNAVKFTDTGCISLSVKGRKESYGYNLMISVSDTGIGMSEESIERILEGYDRIGTTRTKRGEGIGLGMAISKLLSKTLGGVITINSKQGEGSTFTLVVPQKVISEKPLISIDRAETIDVCYYLDFEKYENKALRDAYSRMPMEIAENLGIAAHMCVSIDDIRNRISKSKVTHVFIGKKEYEKYKEYFDSLIDKRIKVILCIDSENDDIPVANGITKFDKPFYSLRVAKALLNHTIGQDGHIVTEQEEFKTKSVTALVVDDNKMNIHVVKNLLKKFDIEVDGVMSGAEALDKVNSMKYDVIFMDHMMPEMDGVETTHRIRGKFGEYFQRVPIVALTANAIAGSREMYLKEGFSDFMEKPVEPSVMERVLKRVIQQDKQIQVISRNIEVVEKKMDNKNVLDSLDIETGLMYCGGEENYGAILAECVLSYNDTLKELNEAYNSEDYSLYVIKIHGLKSTMKSVGAMELSEKARVLEFAGKAGEYNKIKSGHSEVMEDYYEMMKAVSEYGPAKDILGDSFVFDEYAAVSGGNTTKKVDADNSKELMELGGSDFEEIKKNFENAMYGLDVDIMKAIVSELKNYRVGNVSLDKIADKMEHKIDMGDYFSAGDLLFNVEEA